MALVVFIFQVNRSDRGFSDGDSDVNEEPLRIREEGDYNNDRTCYK